MRLPRFTISSLIDDLLICPCLLKSARRKNVAAFTCFEPHPCILRRGVVQGWRNRPSPCHSILVDRPHIGKHFHRAVIGIGHLWVVFPQSSSHQCVFDEPLNAFFRPFDGIGIEGFGGIEAEVMPFLVPRSFLTTYFNIIIRPCTRQIDVSNCSDNNHEKGSTCCHMHNLEANG